VRLTPTGQPTRTPRQINLQQDTSTLKPPQSAFSGCFQLSFDYLVSTYEYRDGHIYAQRSRGPKIYYHFDFRILATEAVITNIITPSLLSLLIPPYLNQS
jgi:hypothetical protein